VGQRLTDADRLEWFFGEHLLPTLLTRRLPNDSAL
jgi:hypothetical protein